MRVLYVATVVKTHIMEFHVPYLKMIKEMGWETAVAAKNDYLNVEECKIPYCDAFYNVPFERNPLNGNNIVALKMLKRIIDEGNYDIIHCHTPVGAMLTRIAAEDVRKHGSKVFYTAHGFHFYKGSPLVNWVAYYPVEKYLAKKTDVLITINTEDYELAKHSFKARQIEYVHGVGINISKFSSLPNAGDRNARREQFGLDYSDFVLLSVGELIPRKNHKVVIEALNILKNSNELGNIHYLICGDGKLRRELEETVKNYSLESNVHFLGYREDIDKIYAICDLFVFMSLQEGLPVSVMEAMASRLPVICSDIRGNRDLIRDQVNGEFVDNNPRAVAEQVLKLKRDDKLRKAYALHARQDINDYSIEAMVNTVKKLYIHNI